MTKNARARPAPGSHRAPPAPPQAADPQADLLGELALDAAADLFRRRGYAGTSLRQVAEVAHLHPGSLHWRWPTKEALLVALMERALRRVTAAVTEAMAALGPEADLADRLRLGLRAHLSMLLSGDASFHVLLYDWRSLEGEARAALLRLRGSYEEFWDAFLEAAQEAGLARPGVDRMLVRQFGFGAMNWVAQWYEPGRGPTPGEIADAFWDYLAFGLLADHRRAGPAKITKFAKVARVAKAARPAKPATHAKRGSR